MNSNLDKIVELYRTLQRPPIEDHVFKGYLDEQLFKNEFSFLEEAGHIRQTKSVKDESSVFIEVVNLPASFAIDISSLFKSSMFSSKLPDKFYIADQDYLHGSESQPTDAILKLIHIYEILNMLVHYSNHAVQESGTHELIFLTPKGKCEVQCQLEDVCFSDVSISPHRFQSLMELLSKKEHNSQKKTIVASSIITLLRTVSGSKRFNYLLSHFDEFAAVVLGNYELFVSEFNFHDILKDFEERKISMLGKIDDIVSNIQGKILTLPVAVVLASMKYTNSEIMNIGDTMVFAGTVVFVLLIFWLLDNQNDTLQSLNMAVEDQKTHELKDGPMLVEQLERGFKDIERRIYKQSQRLKYIRAMVWACFIASLFLFLYSSGLGLVVYL